MRAFWASFFLTNNCDGPLNKLRCGMFSSEETNDLGTIKKLLILQMLWDGIPAELISKATGLNPNSIRNMFQLSKFKKGGK